MHNSLNAANLNEVLDKVLTDLLLVPLGDVLDDDLGLLQTSVAQEPPGTFRNEPPVTEKQ